MLDNIFNSYTGGRGGAGTALGGWGLSARQPLERLPALPWLTGLTLLFCPELLPADLVPLCPLACPLACLQQTRCPRRPRSSPPALGRAPPCLAVAAPATAIQQERQQQGRLQEQPLVVAARCHLLRGRTPSPPPRAARIRCGRRSRCGRRAWLARITQKQQLQALQLLAVSARHVACRARFRAPRPATAAT